MKVITEEHNSIFENNLQQSLTTSKPSLKFTEKQIKVRVTVQADNARTIACFLTEHWKLTAELIPITVSGLNEELYPGRRHVY